MFILLTFYIKYDSIHMQYKKASLPMHKAHSLTHSIFSGEIFFSEGIQWRRKTGKILNHFLTPRL